MGKKEQILSVALDLFSNEGYERTGIQKIVDEVGVTKPTLYHYFGSKKGLLEAIITQYFKEFWVGFKEACEYENDIIHNLEKITKHYFKFARNNPVFYKWYQSIIYSPAQSDPGSLILPILKKQWQLLEELFMNASVDHGNMRGRASRYNISFLGMINAYITTSTFGEISLSEESAYLACKQFMHGIYS